MRRLILISALLIITLSINAQSKNHRYAIKSGYIKYELTGNTTGTIEIWWDDYGYKTRTLTQSTTVTKMFGMKNEDKKHTLVIINKDMQYVIDYISNRNTKIKIPFYPELVINKDMTEAEQKELADKILDSLGGERLGTEKVLSYNCEVVTALGFKSWVYKGIALKTAGKMLGIEANQTAVKFSPNKSISSSQFQPPSGVKFEDLSEAEGNPFAAAIQESENIDLDDDSEVVEDVISTKYPYDKFRSKINAFKYNGYSKAMLTSLKGVHTGMFMKGFSNSIVIVATSKKNAKNNDINNYNTFTHNGKKCYFGTENGEKGKSSALVMDIPSYDTYIIIATSPTVTKTEMLKIADKLGF